MSRQVDYDCDSGLARLLDGLGLDEDLCDFTIADQNDVVESQGITPTTPSNFKPVLGENVIYVVACVIINDSNEVLMMQEAKECCAGKWYLPAGHMEKGETITQATIRIVLEETGLQCKPNTLLIVETAGGMWYRFVLAGDVISGELKTSANADKKSLQAKWIGNLQEIAFRSDDLMHLVKRARLYKQNKSIGSWHKDIFPAPTPHVKDLIRLIIVIKKRSTNKLHVLISEKTATHFPVCEINPAKSVHSTLSRFMEEMFGANVGQHRPLGLLNVEADPSADGCCLTLLVSLRAPLEEVSLIGTSKCVWQEVSHDIASKLLTMITTKYSTIELHVVY